MGNLSDRATLVPQAIEHLLPWGAALRGLRWGSGPDVALLLHEPGADIDAWTTLPVELARQLEIETLAVDLPGHGLSDDPWEPARLPDLLRALPDLAPSAVRRFLIAAGTPAVATLEQAPALGLSGLVCLSPRLLTPGGNPPRSPRVPKLFVAGSLAGSDLEAARRLAVSCGGWSVVTSLPVAERGTALLASAWGGQLVEQIITFVRDSQRRPALANPLLRGCDQAPNLRGAVNPPSPVSDGPGTCAGVPSGPGG